MSAATATIIRFPPPPPTRNELSFEQRARLRRTNNKLGQVLGSTPHVLDLSYIVPKTHIELPTSPKTPKSSKNPFRKAHTRSASVPKVDMDSVRALSKSPDSVASRASSSSHRSASSVRVKTDELAWRTPYGTRRPPLLQLAVPSPARSRKPDLETIPGSPPFQQPGQAFESPSFSLPTSAALRREKMRRVRKMLGDGVPADLVFPSYPEGTESESEEDSPLLSTPTSTMSREWLLVNVDKPLPTEPSAPSPSPQPAPTLVERPSSPRPRASKKTKENAVRRDRLFKERPKERPSKGAKRLESIAESHKEARPDSLTVLGVSASAGMAGKGRSRRFIEGELMMDQIGTPWGNWSSW